MDMTGVATTKLSLTKQSYAVDILPATLNKAGLFHSPKLVVNFWRKVMFFLPNIAQL